MEKFDINIVVNAHREGDWLHSCLKSLLLNLEEANRWDIRSKINVILDNADEATKVAAKHYSKIASIHEVEFGDLSRSRNFGASRISSVYTGFVDGDDMCGRNWIVAAYKLAESLKKEFIVIHPQTNMFFGRDVIPHFWFHPDMRHDNLSLPDLLATNRWTSLCFASTKTFSDFPYNENKILDGYGYEDWLWNLETFLAGAAHIVADDTIHFIRRGGDHSLLQQTNRALALPRLYLINNKFQDWQ